MIHARTEFVCAVPHLCDQRGTCTTEAIKKWVHKKRKNKINFDLIEVEIERQQFFQKIPKLKKYWKKSNTLRLESCFC